VRSSLSRNFPLANKQINRWLQKSGLDSSPTYPDLSHLKRIRKDLSSGVSSILLSPSPDPLMETMLPPPELGIGHPYQVAVPKHPARTLNSVKLKANLWPTLYAPLRKGEPEPWSRGMASWAVEAMRTVIHEASKAKEKGEVRFILIHVVPDACMSKP
jgi:tRNA-specific adenosine deaminase 3